MDLAISSNLNGRPAEAARRFLAVKRAIVRSHAETPAVMEIHARVLLGLSSSRLEIRGDPAESMALLEEAEELTVRAGAVRMQAAVRGQRGLLLLRQGDTTGSLRALDRACDLIEAAEPLDQMRILLNRGALNLERGALRQAHSDLARCEVVARDADDGDIEFMAGHNLAYVEFLDGNIPRALAGMSHAAARDHRGPRPVSLLDKARVLREAGLLADAEQALQHASRLFLGARQFQDLGETELVRAECALVDGEPAVARRLASAARRRFAKRQNLRWQRKAELLVLQAERACIGDATDARARTARRRLVLRAEKLAWSCRDEARADLARKAALLEAEARILADPRDTPASTLLRLASGDPMSTRLHTRAVRAQIALSTGDVATCCSQVRRGLAELTSYQSRFGSLELRTASAVHGVTLARLDLEVAVRSGRPSAVLASIERSRAASTRMAAVRPPSDEQTASRLAELRHVEEEARSLEGDAASAEALARLRGRVAELQRAVRERAWEREGASAVARTVAGFGELRSALGDDGAVFVSYAVHRGRWLALVVGRRRAEVVPLGDVEMVEQLVRRVRADLDALAMPRLPVRLRQAVRQSLTLGLARLDEELVAPLHVQGDRLVVSAGGSLSVLPWSLLSSTRRLPVVVAPSATAWLRARSTPSGRPRVTVVAGPGLTRADDEAVRVHRLWEGSSLLAGGQATTRNVGAALAEADVVHVAAHGTHQQESPLFSCVRLADGPWYAYELDADSRVAACVVLSACEAGLSTVTPGDYGLGMASGLLHLGTKSVLAGVARVRDDVAAEVMERVHRSMTEGVDSAAALASAQADCADHEAPAPFVSFGATWRP